MRKIPTALNLNLTTTMTTMTNDFSKIQFSFPDFEQDAQLEALLSRIEPFTEKERTPEARRKRIQRALQSHEAFDEEYFPKEMYEGYAPNCELHHYIGDVATSGGVRVIFGPRKHGKTVKGKKTLLWMLLSGNATIAGTYAETLMKSANILKDCVMLLQKNERIMEDFKIEFAEANSDQCQFRITADLSFVQGDLTKILSWKFIATFSQDRSVRGYTRLFGRAQFVLGDDLETLESSFSNQAVQLRLDKIAETFQSLADGGTFLILANNFTTAGALYRLKIEQDNGILAKGWTVATFKAWMNETAMTELERFVSFGKQSRILLSTRGGFSLWHEKYPANSESELKELLMPKTESDWQANFQQNPVPPEGDFFKRELYKEWTSVPNDARGVLWTDPNLSKKSKGDTTASPSYKYSVTTDCYYITEAICRSFADSNKLLDEVFRMRAANEIKNLGFDGNVSQESTWTNNVRNWCRINNQSFPHVEYRRYHVDEIAKNFQAVYASGKVFFPPNFAKTPDGERFLSQFFAFTGTKKSGGKDDAPDSVICAHEFIHERKLTKKPNRFVKAFEDYYSR